MSCFNLLETNGYQHNVMSTWARFSAVTELWIEAKMCGLKREGVTHMRVGMQVCTTVR